MKKKYTFLKDFSKTFKKYSKNILRIFPQKQSQKQSKSRPMWLVLSHLHPISFVKKFNFENYITR
jgi:hypothetical protein